MIKLLKKLSIIFILISCTTNTDTTINSKIKDIEINQDKINIIDSTIYTYETKYRIIDSINIINIYDTIKVEYIEYVPEIIYEYQNKVVTVYDTIFTEVQYCTEKGFLCRLLCGKK